MNFGENGLNWSLMHKFVERSRIGIFHNEGTRSTPLDQNLCFGAFWTFSLLHELQCKRGQTGVINAQVHRIKSHRNFSQRTHPFHTIGPSIFSLLHELQWKRGRTGAIDALVRRTKLHRNFSQRTHPIVPHRTPNSGFAVFRTILLQHQLGANGPNWSY
jgi:hypothetical protein